MDLEIINIASDTDNNRNIKDRTHYSKLKSALCGEDNLWSSCDDTIYKILKIAVDKDNNLLIILTWFIL